MKCATHRSGLARPSLQQPYPSGAGFVPGPSALSWATPFSTRLANETPFPHSQSTALGCDRPDAVFFAEGKPRTHGMVVNVVVYEGNVGWQR